MLGSVCTSLRALLVLLKPFPRCPRRGGRVRAVPCHCFRLRWLMVKPHRVFAPFQRLAPLRSRTLRGFVGKGLGSFPVSCARSTTSSALFGTLTPPTQTSAPALSLTPSPDEPILGSSTPSWLEADQYPSAPRAGAWYRRLALATRSFPEPSASPGRAQQSRDALGRLRGRRAPNQNWTQPPVFSGWFLVGQDPGTETPMDSATERRSQALAAHRRNLSDR